jgi:hypothetical protein
MKQNLKKVVDELLGSCSFVEPHGAIISHYIYKRQLHSSEKRVVMILDASHTEIGCYVYNLDIRERGFATKLVSQVNIPYGNDLDEMWLSIYQEASDVEEKEEVTLCIATNDKFS